MMLRKLLALLVLIPAQLFAQGIDYTVTPSTVGAPAPMENINQNQIGIPLNLGDDSTTGAINLGFQFSFYGQNFSSTYISNNGVIGFQSPINGCCQGYDLATNDQYTRYGIYVFQTDLYNFGTMNPYYKAFEDRFVVGWYNMGLFGGNNFRSTYEITLFQGSNDILLNYGDVNSGGRFFTAGIRGDDAAEYEVIYSGTDGNYMDFRSWLLSPGSPPPPVNWVYIAAENGSFVLLTETVVRYGANGVFTTLTLPPGTYSCSNSLFGDPIGGVVKACEIPSQNVNCTSDPTNPQCAVQAYTDPTTIATDLAEAAADAALADTTDATDASTDSTETTDESVAEEELVAAADEEESSSEEEVSSEENLEEMLAADEDITAEEIAVEDAAEAEKEETEEKLADAIDPSLLNLVLSIVESTSVVDNSGATAGASSASTTTTSSSDSSNSSGSTTVTASASRTETASSSEVVFAESTRVEDAAIVVAENSSETSSEIANESLNEAIQFVASESATNAAINAQMNNMLNADADVARESTEIVAINQTSESAFDDKTDIDLPVLSFDPNSPLSQFINNMPSIANQEAAGVLGNRQDKSDAEVRAEQVVAANKEEQDAINSNYMDADQSGIVAAMGSDVDFTSYRSASLQDANLWYKPEDIYKNIVLKDNVRGSYFLEKGSTDTYKKMVAEQYK